MVPLEPEQWVAFAFALVPLAGVAFLVAVAIDLDRPVSRVGHPFVRFPIWVTLALVAPAFLLERPAWWGWFLFAPLGGMFLGTHLRLWFHRVNARKVPRFPSVFDFSVHPFLWATSVYVLLSLLYASGWVRFCFLVWPSGWVLLVQAAYGVYFVCAHLSQRPSFSSVWWAVAPVAFLTKAGRASVVNTTLLGAVGLTTSVMVYKTSKNDQRVRILELELQARTLELHQAERADKQERFFIQSKIDYTREENVIFRSPGPSAEKPLSPGLPLAEPNKELYSPLEEFSGPPWLVDFILETDFSPAVDAAAVVVVSGLVWSGWKLVRFLKRKVFGRRPIRLGHATPLKLSWGKVVPR